MKPLYHWKTKSADLSLLTHPGKNPKTCKTDQAMTVLRQIQQHSQ